MLSAVTIHPHVYTASSRAVHICRVDYFHFHWHLYSTAKRTPTDQDLHCSPYFSLLRNHLAQRHIRTDYPCCCCLYSPFTLSVSVQVLDSKRRRLQHFYDKCIYAPLMHAITHAMQARSVQRFANVGEHFGLLPSATRVGKLVVLALC